MAEAKAVLMMQPPTNDSWGAGAALLGGIPEMARTADGCAMVGRWMRHRSVHRTVSDSCSPATLIGVDPFPEQIEYARGLPVARVAEFKLADALNLPFADRSFDVVVSALVINFVPDRPRGLAEMRRVAKPGGLVAGYVWDFAGGRSTGAPLVKGLRAIGLEPPTIPGTADSSLDAFQSLFRQTGLQEVEARAIEITASYRDFDDSGRHRQRGSARPRSSLLRSVSPSNCGFGAWS
jgi:SAM-dependent methyltransferase